MLVETFSLSKHYGALPALDDCTVNVQRGEVFGLLGPNGAGKTTLLRLLLGYLRPTSGQAKIDGLDCYHQSLKVRRLVSYLPGDARLFRQMRGRDALRFFAEVRPEGDWERSLVLAERLELDLSRRVAFMSTGMRQKLALVVALAAHTPLLILDEPTSNLDPTVRAAVTDLVREAKAGGRTVVFSSHVLPEVEEVCDRVVILRKGHLVHTQLMCELRRRHRIRATINGPRPNPPDGLRDQVRLKVDGQQVVIDTSGEIAPLLSWLGTLQLGDMTIEPIGLRTVYDHYHGQEVGDGEWDADPKPEAGARTEMPAASSEVAATQDEPA